MPKFIPKFATYHRLHSVILHGNLLMLELLNFGTWDSSGQGLYGLLSIGFNMVQYFSAILNHHHVDLCCLWGSRKLDMIDRKSVV